MQNELGWMREIMASDLDRKRKLEALELLDGDLEEPPGWLRPWLTRRDSEWCPAVPDSADVPEVGPVECD